MYCKLLINSTAQGTMAENVRKNKPPKGMVQMLTVTEKQFARMEYVAGEWSCDVVDSDERLIEL